MLTQSLSVMAGDLGKSETPLRIAKSKNGGWIRIESSDSQTVIGLPMRGAWTSFHEVATQSLSEGSIKTAKWNDLTLPLPTEKILSLGLGLTYPSHQVDVANAQVTYFEKNSAPTPLTDPIQFRANLDYEAEISILLHRSEPQLFGFLAHNDLTDRAIQVASYDPKNPAPGFSKAKSFAGANQHGLIMAIGGNELWNRLSLSLDRNASPVQIVKSRENLLNPESMHRYLFHESAWVESDDWILIGTGTPTGTIFRAPTFSEKLFLFLRAGFRRKRAEKLWLDQFNFLQVGDTLEFRSEILGEYSAPVVSE